MGKVQGLKSKAGQWQVLQPIARLEGLMERVEANLVYSADTWEDAHQWAASHAWMSDAGFGIRYSEVS